MAALRSRCGHYIFALCLYSFLVITCGKYVSVMHCFQDVTASLVYMATCDLEHFLSSVINLSDNRLSGRQVGGGASMRCG